MKYPNDSVLIVDDNPFNRELLKEFLSMEQFVISEARNGREALNLLKDSTFKMIFMDLLMPGMDGFETIRRIRNMGVTTPIIIVSSMSSREDRQRCLEAGGNDFLPKPISIETIKELVNKYREFENQPQISPSLKKNKVTRTEFSRLSHYHILLVEEENILANRYYRFLKNAGFEVTRAFNGNQVIELFEKNRHKFNIIISNVFTSGIDGLGLLDRIKRDYANVLMFIYAEEEDADTFQLAIQLGADGVISQSKFEHVIIELIESAVYKIDFRSSRTQAVSTARQVREAQSQLIKFGCPESCGMIDIAYSPLTDAGGDFACCRRFNRAGRCGIILGDVSGHNVMTSYISAIFLGILTPIWSKNQKPMDLLKVINAELNKSDYEQYHLCATAILWDRNRQKVSIATAGSPGVLVGKDKTFKSLNGGGMCLGLLKEDNLFLSDEITLNAGEFLFIFSDGIDEQEIIQVILEGKIDLNRQNISGISRQIIDKILDQRRQQDDMILITLTHPTPLNPPKVGRDIFFPPSGGMRGVERDAKGGEFLYSFPSGYKGVELAYEWASSKCIPDMIPKGNDPFFVMFALREALLNAVIHGNRLDPGTFVDLSIFYSPGTLRMEISDEGSGFELGESIPKIKDINLLQSGGRGIPAIYTIADGIEVDGGTVSIIFKEK